jgi:hypothetical protein
MRESELDTLLDAIANKLDVYEVLDLLGWTLHDLVNYCKEEINRHSEEFEQALL